MKSRPLMPQLDELQRYTVEEAIAYLRPSRKALFEDIKSGRLATIKEGKRRYIPGVRSCADPVRHSLPLRQRRDVPISTNGDACSVPPGRRQFQRSHQDRHQ